MLEGTRSLRRLSADYRAVADSLDSEESARAFRRVTKPTSLTGVMRKTGIALAVAPEPFTTVAGVALVAASFAMKGKEPASLETLREETLTQLSELKSLGTDLTSLAL